MAACVPPAHCWLRGCPQVTLQQTVPKLEGLHSDGPRSLWSLPSKSSAGMQNFGLLLHPSRVTKGHHSCSRTKQDVLFAPLLPSESVTYLTSNEGSLFCAAHFWAVWWRRANVLIHVGLCKQSAEGRVSAGANCSCKVVGGVLWIYTRLGIPPTPSPGNAFLTV